MSSSATRKHSTLLWSPHAAEIFAIGTSEHLKLYRFGDAAGGAQMELLGAVPDVQLRCVEWCPDLMQPWTFAIGTGSGRVVLHDCTPAALRTSATSSASSALCEFVPRFQRVCFSAAWNPLQTQQVAAGLDKVRSDYGVLVWDVTRGRGGTRSVVADDGDAESACGSRMASGGMASSGGVSVAASAGPTVRGSTGGHAQRERAGDGRGEADVERGGGPKAGDQRRARAHRDAQGRCHRDRGAWRERRRVEGKE